MIQAGALAYFDRVKGSYRPLRAAHNFRTAKPSVALLWGDEVYVISVDAERATVSAKGHHLQLPVADLRETPILSVYQIDCGQGDAALVHLPDGRWMMVDGGPPHEWSNSGKIAADFLAWKMFVDQSWKAEFGFRKQPFRIDALVCTHPDYDHFGGFAPLTERVRAKTLEYGTVFHNGMGRFGGGATAYGGGAGFGQLGPVAGRDLPDAFVTTMLDGFDDVREYQRATGSRTWKLSGTYGTWLRGLAELEGSGVGALRRVHHESGHLPGFEPNGGGVAVRVLGPVQETWQGRPALRYLDGASKSSMGSPSLTRNGHSIVLRLDYDRVRVLLTGDLNFRSHALLLRHLPPAEFACHVAKACHHGSEDVSATFLRAMAPLVTMFSSGDNEAYAHPRAKVLGLAGALGQPRHGRSVRFLDLEEPLPVAPLIYSTELSRSVEIFAPHSVWDRGGNRIPNPQIQARGRTRTATGRRASLNGWLLANKMVYGLINVRTDGRKIVMAVLKESDSSFQTEELTV